MVTRGAVRWWWFTLLQSSLLVVLASAGTTVWQASPLSPASVTSVNAWEDVAGTSVNVSVADTQACLVDYYITVTGTWNRPLGMGEGSPSVRQNFVQLRVVVDGAPLRESSSHASPGTVLPCLTVRGEGQGVCCPAAKTNPPTAQPDHVYEVTTDVLSGHAVVSLTPGSHLFRLQWKKVCS